MNKVMTLNDLVLDNLFQRLPTLADKPPEFAADFLLDAIDKLPPSALLKIISDSLEARLEMERDK
jgi:hypothetical protein